ncbi:hypothetical protein ACS0TY_011981 [Phlomoides rotata]
MFYGEKQISVFKMLIHLLLPWFQGFFLFQDKEKYGSFVSISPKGMKSLYEGIMAEHSKINMDVRALIRRLIAMGESSTLKSAIAMDDPLVKLMAMFEEEVQMSPGTGKNVKLKKKLFSGTSPSNKKSTSDVEAKAKVEVVNID